MKWELLPIALILTMFGLSAYFYQILPQDVPIHWDSDGNTDGYGSRFTGTFLLPLIAAGIYLLITFIPYIAVYQKNIKSFHFYLYGFKVVFLLFFLVLHIAALLAASGKEFNMNYVVLPMLSFLLFGMSILLSKAKRNYFIGIRTPWTLKSEKVWNKTHKVGAFWLKIVSLLVLLTIFLEHAVVIIIGILVIYFLAIITYSYKI